MADDLGFKPDDELGFKPANQQGMKSPYDLSQFSPQQMQQATGGAQMEPHLMELLKNAGAGAVRGLDYGGGLVRTGVQQGIDLGTGQDHATPWGEAFKGNAKKMGDYATESGMAPIPAAILGLVGDVALDPVTYLSGGLSAASKGKQLAGVGGHLAELLKLAEAAGEGSKLTRGGEIANKFLNPLENLSQKAGRGIYNSAFDKADRNIMTDSGRGSIADILHDARFKGNADQALEKTQELHGTLGENIGATRNAAHEAGVTSNMANVSEAKPQFDKMRNVIRPLLESEDPVKVAEGNTLLERIQRLENIGDKSPRYFAEQKRLENPGRSWMAQQVREPLKAAEDKLDVMTEGAMNAAENAGMNQHLGDTGMQDYLKMKRDYGTTGAFAQKQLQKMANRESNMTGIGPSAVDLLSAPILASKGSPGAWGLIGKKLRDVSRFTAPKTTLGLGMEDLGQNANGVIDSLARQGIEIPALLQLIKQNQSNQGENK